MCIGSTLPRNESWGAEQKEHTAADTHLTAVTETAQVQLSVFEAAADNSLDDASQLPHARLQQSLLLLRRVAEPGAPLWCVLAGVRQWAVQRYDSRLRQLQLASKGDEVGRVISARSVVVSLSQLCETLRPSGDAHPCP